MDSDTGPVLSCPVLSQHQTVPAPRNIFEFFHNQTCIYSLQQAIYTFLPQSLITYSSRLLLYSSNYCSAPNNGYEYSFHYVRPTLGPIHIRFAADRLHIMESYHIFSISTLDSITACVECCKMGSILVNTTLVLRSIKLLKLSTTNTRQFSNHGVELECCTISRFRSESGTLKQSKTLTGSDQFPLTQQSLSSSVWRDSS